MVRHIDMVQAAFETELAQLHAMMDKDLEGADEHEQDAYFSNINDYWIDTAETIPLLQWYAQLLVAYGYFENLINNVCSALRMERDYTLALKDLHGQGITRAKAYLSKVAGIPEVFGGKEWDAIRQVAEARNVVAHRNGFVDHEPNNAKSTYSKLSAQQNLELKQEVMNQPDAQVVISCDYVKNAITSFDAFTRAVFSRLKGG